MHLIFITGTSRGIGKALAETTLKKTDFKVIGIGRSQTIHHENYHHLNLDLADIPSVKSFQFPEDEKATKVSLINNAGHLGEVGPLGKIPDDSLEDVLHINLVAVAILMNKFIRQFGNFTGEKTIINISSGAAQSPYDGWSAYCTSKAGLDMLTRVADLEQKLRSDVPVKVFAIAPGIVATRMQAQIRTVDEANFSRKKKFVEFYEQNLLTAPETVAEKILGIFEIRNKFENVVLTIQDL